MDYNSGRERIVLLEYGRHVKLLVENCLKIEDREKRNTMAKEIIELMGQLNPHLRNVEDFRPKLWDHLFMISEFRLDVDSPYPKTTKTQIIERPEPLKYPKSKIRHRNYGKNVETLVNKAIAETNPVKKAGLAQLIGNYMKLTYQNWNKDNTNDEIIKNDLRILSRGELNLTVEDNISGLSAANKPRPSNNNGQNQNNQNRSNNNNNGQNSYNKNKNKNKYKHHNKNRNSNPVV